MKTKKMLSFLMVLTIALTFVMFSFATVNAVTINPDKPFTVTAGAVVENSTAVTDDGQIYVSNLIHAQLVYFNAEFTVDDANDYLNLKVKVTNIHRIKLRIYTIADGATDEAGYDLVSHFGDTDHLFDANGETTARISLAESYMGHKITRISMQVYISGEGVIGTLVSGGIKIDGDGTVALGDFPTIVGESKTTEINLKAEDQWQASSNVTLAANNDELVENHASGVSYGYQTATFSNTTGDSVTDWTENQTYILIPLAEDANAWPEGYANLYLNYKASAGIKDINVYVNKIMSYQTDPTATPPVQTGLGKGCYFVGASLKGKSAISNTPNYMTATANIGNYINNGDTAWDGTVSIFNLDPLEKATALILQIEFEEGAVASEQELDIAGISLGTSRPIFKWDGEAELKLSDLTAPSSATATKDPETGYQTVQYSQSPGYHTFNVSVSNFNIEDTPFLEIVVNPDDDIKMCIAVDGKIDWGIGHADYLGSIDNKVVIDLTKSTYGTLPANFTIEIYLDAAVTVEAQKTLVFKTIKLRGEETIEVPDYPYVSNVTATAMAFQGDYINGWNVAYSYDADAWRKAVLTVSNHTVDYDTVIFSLNAVKGMKLGIRLGYLDDNNVEQFVYLRNHWNDAQSIFTSDGQVSLVFYIGYLGEQFKKQISSIEMYFDVPANDYEMNQTDTRTSVSAVEFKKQSELGLESIGLDAKDLIVVYTGEKVVYTATNEAEVELIYEFKSATDDTAEFSSSVPSAAGEYIVRISYPGSLSYGWERVEKKVTISKADQTTPTASDVSVNYTTGVITFDSALEVSTTNAFASTDLVASGSVVAPGSTLYVRLPGDDNTNASEVLTLTVNGKSTVPSGVTATATDTTITVTEVANAEYCLVTGETAGAWQSSNVFEGLTAETEYTVKIRVKATDTNFASDESSLQVTTLAAAGGCAGCSGMQAYSFIALTFALMALLVVVRVVRNKKFN